MGRDNLGSVMKMFYHDNREVVTYEFSGSCLICHHSGYRYVKMYKDVSYRAGCKNCKNKDQAVFIHPGNSTHRIGEIVHDVKGPFTVAYRRLD